MNGLVTKLADELKAFNLISLEKEDNYIYGLEMLIMKILGFLFIAIIGISTKKYLETIIFYITFVELRSFTNGYHSKNYIVCLLESALVYTVICMIAKPIITNYLTYSHIATVVSIAIIFMLSPINSDDIMLDDDEIQYHKEMIKYILITYLIFLAMFVNLKVKFEMVIFFELAIILDMILVVLGRYTAFKEGGRL